MNKLRFAVCLHSAQDFAWFPNYAAYMGATTFTLDETRGNRPAGTPAWDHWVWVGVEIDQARAVAFIEQLPPQQAKVEQDHRTHLPTNLLPAA